MSEKRNRQRFTKEFKEDAVRLVLEQGYSGIEVARGLGVNPSNVTRWVREYRDEKRQLSETEKSHRELEAEIRQLKKENQRLQMEREVLKKAAAFFAKESN